MPSNNQPLIRLAQISDLHFIKDLTEKGRKYYLKQFLTRSHAFDKISDLSRELLRIQHPMWGKDIDVLIATGDISTDGSKDALQTALGFIENQEVRDDHGVLITHGLDKQRHQRLVLPGNHDRFTATWFPQQVSSRELESVFKIGKSY